MKIFEGELQKPSHLRFTTNGFEYTMFRMKIFEGELKNPAISVSPHMVLKTPCFE